MSKIIHLIVASLFISAVSACSPSSIAQSTGTLVLSSPTTSATQALTASPSSTITLTPTFTASPSSTPTQTHTPTPTETNTPSPTPLGGGLGEIAFNSPAGIEILDITDHSRLPLGIWGSWLAWFPSGEVLSYFHYLGGSQASHELCVFNLKESQETCMKLKATNTSLPFSVSSDEKSILFGSRSSDGEKVYIVVPSNNNQRLIESGDYPTWSPDGSKIAFTVDGRIHTMNADGSNSSMLVAMAGNSFLSWSPGGDKIAYVSHNSGYGDVYVTTLDGMQTRLSYSSNYDGYIAWSGDGSKLAYITAYSLSYAGLFGDVVVVDFSDNTTRQITSVVGATSASPSWSPDGQWLTFGACKTGQSRPNCAIFIVKSDGTELQQVKDYEQYETQPVWRP